MKIKNYFRQVVLGATEHLGLIDLAEKFRLYGERETPSSMNPSGGIYKNQAPFRRKLFNRKMEI